jgi:hypothetical protein
MRKNHIKWVIRTFKFAVFISAIAVVVNLPSSAVAQQRMSESQCISALERRGLWPPPKTVYGKVKEYCMRGELRSAIKVIQNEQKERRPGRGDEASASTEMPRRTIRSDGTVEINYPDGTIKRFFASGGWETIPPGGTPQRVMPMEVRPDIPPSLPDSAEREWLDYHNGRLLDIIRLLVGDEAVDNYLQFEGMNRNPYERTDMRSRTISHLLSP